MIDFTNVVDYLTVTWQNCDDPLDTYQLAEQIIDRITSDNPTMNEIDEIIDELNAEYRLVSKHDEH
jgi:hypothetical protein